MPRLQELIHSLEVGSGARYLRALALVLIVVTLAVVYNLREFQNLRGPDAMDAAQVARNLAEGRGFTTRYVRPLSMGVVMRHRTDRDPQVRGEHPDLVNAPLYPLVLSAFMRIPGLFDYQMVSPKEGIFRRHQPDFLIAVINQVFFFTAIFLAWRLARRLFDDRVAFLTTLALIGCDLLWQFSASGQSTMLGMALFMALMNVVYQLDDGSRAEGPPKRGRELVLAILVGLLCALLLLTRYSFGVVVLPLLAYLAAGFPGRRLLLPAAALVVFLATIAPWLVRNTQVCGNPFGLAPYSLVEETSIFSENWLERSMEPEIAKVGSDDIVRKFSIGASEMLRNDLTQLGGSWLTAFFLAGLLVPFVQAARTRLRWLTVGIVACLAVAQILSKTHLSNDLPRVNSENLIVLAAPLVFIFGIALVTLLVWSLEVSVEIWRNIIIGGVMLVLWLPLLVTFGPPRTFPIAYPPYYPPTIQRIAEWFQPGELIMSDMPWAVAWYGNRQSLLLTRSPEQEFLDVNDWQKPVSGVYLTRITLDQRFLSGWVLNARQWGRFIIEILTKGEVPKGFPLRKAPAFMTTFPDHLLLADKDRWQETAPVSPPKALQSKSPEAESAPERPKEKRSGEKIDEVPSRATPAAKPATETPRKAGPNP